MSNITVWLGVRQDVKASLRGWISDYKAARDSEQPYNGPYPDLIKAFVRARRAENVSRSYKKYVSGPNNWTLFAITFTKGKGGLTPVRDDILALEAASPNNAFSVLGAWRDNGTQIGTDPTTGEGTATYPVDPSILLRFMPDEEYYSDPGVGCTYELNEDGTIKSFENDGTPPTVATRPATTIREFARIAGLPDKDFTAR